MNKDDQSFFAAIRKGSSSASGVLLLKADFRIVWNDNGRLDKNLKALERTCKIDCGFLPKSFIVFPLTGVYKDYVLVVVYKEFLPPTTNFEKRGKQDIKKKFDALMVANNSSKGNKSYYDWDKKTSDNICYKDRNGDKTYAPKVCLPLITFFKHDKTIAYVWPDKIKTLSDIMNKQKDFYYRDEEDYRHGHKKSYGEAMSDVDAEDFFRGLGIEWERVDAYIDKKKLKRNKSKL